MVKQLNERQVKKARELTPAQKKELEDMFPAMVGTIDLNVWNTYKAARQARRIEIEDENERKVRNDE